MDRCGDLRQGLFMGSPTENNQDGSNRRNIYILSPFSLAVVYANDKVPRVRARLF